MRYSIIVDYHHTVEAEKFWDRSEWFIVRKEYPLIKAFQYDAQNEDELLDKIAKDFAKPWSRPRTTFGTTARFCYNFSFTHIFLDPAHNWIMEKGVSGASLMHPWYELRPESFLSNDGVVDKSHLIEQLNGKIQTRRAEVK